MDYDDRVPNSVYRPQKSTWSASSIAWTTIIVVTVSSLLVAIYQLIWKSWRASCQKRKNGGGDNVTDTFNKNKEADRRDPQEVNDVKANACRQLSEMMSFNGSKTPRTDSIFELVRKCYA